MGTREDTVEVVNKELDELAALSTVDTTQWGTPISLIELEENNSNGYSEVNNNNYSNPPQDNNGYPTSNKVNNNNQDDSDEYNMAEQEVANSNNGMLIRIIAGASGIVVLVLLIFIGRWMITESIPKKLNNLESSVPADLTQLNKVEKENRLSIKDIKEIINNAKEVSPISYELSLSVRLSILEQLVWTDINDTTKACVLENGDKLYLRGNEIIYKENDVPTEK